MTDEMNHLIEDEENNDQETTEQSNEDTTVSESQETNEETKTPQRRVLVMIRVATTARLSLLPR